jgi:hypothetical protein
MFDSLMRGESPFASHLLYTQVLDDAIKNNEQWVWIERLTGINTQTLWQFI